jgi:hypothetical protein
MNRSLLLAADLAQLERRIAKEPAYKTRPKYCLLVFGPEAKTHIWLVLDGGTLYVDRNGDGDLTAPGEMVAAEKDDGAKEEHYLFRAGEIRVGTRIHQALTVAVSKPDGFAGRNLFVVALMAKDSKARLYGVNIEVEMRGWKGARIGGRVFQHASYQDAFGLLQFADRPQSAPIIHFGEPSWQIALFGPQRFVIGRDRDMVVGVGTPGVGPGATAYIDCTALVPEKAYPRISISYPPKQPGEMQVWEHYDLKQRC